MNPYDEGTPEWLIYETEGEPGEEPMQFPRVHGLRQPLWKPDRDGYFIPAIVQHRREDCPHLGGVESWDSHPPKLICCDCGADISPQTGAPVISSD